MKNTYTEQNRASADHWTPNAVKGANNPLTLKRGQWAPQSLKNVHHSHTQPQKRPWSRGSLLASYSNNPISNPTVAYSFFCKLWVWKNKKGWCWLIFLNCVAFKCCSTKTIRCIIRSQEGKIVSERLRVGAITGLPRSKSKFKQKVEALNDDFCLNKFLWLDHSGYALRLILRASEISNFIILVTIVVNFGDLCCEFR